jgi:altronate dehydratase large subunit
MMSLPSHFRGFPRTGGKVGVRNHLVVLSTVALTNRWAELISAGIPEAVAIVGEFTRGLRAPDAARQARVCEALAIHPNVGACLVLCHDAESARQWRRRLSGSGRAHTVLALMEQAGMAAAVQAGQVALAALDAQRRAVVRQPCPVGALTLALECGGSDPTSALIANPAIGRVVDTVVDAGGSAVVSETVEFVGAEDPVRSLCRNPEVAERIIAAIAAAEQRMEEDGERYRGVNPTAENIEGGLTTLVEKSMGAVAKVGSRPFTGLLEFGEAPPAPGLYLMDTPFFSPCSITGMVAAGAQLTLFGMGVFNPSGNPLAPTIKVCGNPMTVARWADAIDADLSAVLTQGAGLDQAAQRLGNFVIETAEGSETRAEYWREGQFIVPKTLAPL